MAEEAENLPLDQLIEEQLTILQSDNTTQEQINIAFFRMRQYKPLRDLLDAQKDEVAAKLANPEEIRKLFIDLLSNEQKLIKEGIKHPVGLDEARPPAEIAARAELFAKAQREIPNAAQQIFEQNQKNFPRVLVGKWVKRMRDDRLYNVSPQEEQAIIKSVENLPPTASADETRSAVVGQLQTLAQANPSLSAGQTLLQQIAQTTELAEPAQIQQQMTKTILDHPDVAQPTFVTLLGQGVETTKAVSLTRVAEGLSLDINPAIDVTRPSIIFHAVATTPAEKLLAVIADPIATIFGPEPITKEALEVRWKKLTSPEGLLKLEERFGKEVVSSPLFQQALAHGNRAFEKPMAPGGAAAGASKLIGDVFGSVFGSGIDQKMINEYLELGKRMPIAPGQTITLAGRQTTFLQFYTAFGASWRPGMFHAAFVGGRWMLDWVGIGAKQVVGRLVGAGVKKGIGKLIGGFIGTFGGGPIGTFIGSFIGDKILGGIGKAIGFVAGLFGKGRPGEEKPWYQNWEILFPLILIIVAVGVTFYSVFLSNMIQTSAMADTQGGIGTGGPTIDCTKTPNIPECKLTQCQGDCRWPIDTSTGACIIEGPYVGTHSQSHLSAVDFVTLGGQGRLFGAPVYSQYSGTVISAVFGYLDNSGSDWGPHSHDGGSYGNSVRIQTDKGGTLLFGHLRDIQVVKQGDRISAGTVIGFVDHTGYSKGVHLHYEVRAPGDINSFLPFPVPPCLNYQDCSSKLKATGHSACI